MIKVNTQRPNSAFFSCPLLPFWPSRGARTARARCIVAATMSDGHSSSWLVPFAALPTYVLQTATYNRSASAGALVNHEFCNSVAPQTHGKEERIAVVAENTLEPADRETTEYQFLLLLGSRAFI